jgi:hypothetical protein
MKAGGAHDQRNDIARRRDSRRRYAQRSPTPAPEPLRGGIDAGEPFASSPEISARPEHLSTGRPGRPVKAAQRAVTVGALNSRNRIKEAITFVGGESLTMSPAILVVMPEGYQGRAFVAKNAPALTSSRAKKSIYSILEANSPGVLAQIVGVAERFGFSYRVLDVGAPLPRWPLRIIFRHERGERRIAPRHKVLKSGQIIIPGKRARIIDCTVQNFSSTGATIRLPNAAALPPKFDLFSDNAIRHCIVVWRQGDLMGVKFRPERAREAEW